MADGKLNLLCRATLLLCIRDKIITEKMGTVYLAVEEQYAQIYAGLKLAKGKWIPLSMTHGRQLYKILSDIDTANILPESTTLLSTWTGYPPETLETYLPGLHVCGLKLKAAASVGWLKKHNYDSQDFNHNPSCSIIQLPNPNHNPNLNPNPNPNPRG